MGWRDWRRRPPARPGPAPVGRGVVLRGLVWPGGDGDPQLGVVVVGPTGHLEALGPQQELPSGLRILDGAWVGPGIIDAHVHLAFAAPHDELAGGVVAVRDLGAPPGPAAGWQTPVHAVAGPGVAVAGPLLTAPGGYPSTSWGRDGFARFLTDPQQAAALVRELARDGVDLVKIALEPGDGSLPVPPPDQVRGVVRAAHDAGLPVVAHALSLEMVHRAVHAGVDELAHTPQELLGPADVDAIAAAGLRVVSTLQTFCSTGRGGTALQNAAALHAAGVPILYGTDVGNAGTVAGVDPRELDRLAGAGLGRRGALLAATRGAAAAAGLRGRGGSGLLRVGEPARLVLLAADPEVEPAAWRRPLAVVVGDRIVVGEQA